MNLVNLFCPQSFRNIKKKKKKEKKKWEENKIEPHFFFSFYSDLLLIFILFIERPSPFVEATQCASCPGSSNHFTEPMKLNAKQQQQQIY